MKAASLSVVLLLGFNLNTTAQTPPLPPDGGEPREPTEEEREAQRLAQEAYWAANKERFAPYLHNAPAPTPENLARKQQLIAAERDQKQRKVEEEKLRHEKLRAWTDELREQNRAAQEQVDRLVSPEKRRYFEELGQRIDFRDGRLVSIKSHNVNAAKTIGTWKAKTNAPVDFPLNIKGDLVGMWELSPPGTNHVEFNEGPFQRLVYQDTGTNVVDRPHATLMAGTIAAAGLSPNAVGMANKSTILAKDVDDDLFEMGTTSLDYDLRLSNHSYGENMGWDNRMWYGGGTNDYEDLRFGTYSVRSSQLDSLAYFQPGYLSIWSAGNDRNDFGFSGALHYHFEDDPLVPRYCLHAEDYDHYGGYRTLSPSSSAKNTLVIGAIDDLANGWQSATGVVMTAFSSWGPTRDGRTKPDLVANGKGVYSPSTDSNGDDIYQSVDGTSPAAASVTGSIALLRERLAQTRHPNPTAALIKSLLVNTADEAGTSGPDYKFGHGVMNTDETAALILTNHFFGNPVSTDPLKGVLFEGVLTNGTARNFTVNKTIGTTLSATLVWSDAPGYASQSPTNPMLVNDLDLKIIQGTTTNQSFVLNPNNP